MNLSITCPGCKEILQVKKLPAIGTKVRCFRCQHVFEYTSEAEIVLLKSAAHQTNPVPEQPHRKVVPTHSVKKKLPVTQPLEQPTLQPTEVLSPLSPLQSFHSSDPFAAAQAHVPKNILTSPTEASEPIHPLVIWSMAISGIVGVLVIAAIAGTSLMQKSNSMNGANTLVQANVSTSSPRQVPNSDSPVKKKSQESPPVIAFSESPPVITPSSPANAESTPTSPLENNPAVSTVANSSESPPASNNHPSSEVPAGPLTNPNPMIKTSPAIAGQSPSLEYRLKPDHIYNYHVHLSLKDSNYNLGVPTSASGLIQYTPRTLSAKDLADLQTNLGHGEATGSAFVIHSEGILATCHHVVQGATKIEVEVNGSKYPATLIASDRARDLALLKINATQLPCIALGNSSTVQLAEEVRAVGFPLSNVLGSSIKITRGTIAGFVDQGGKMLQIDASINPGNSGGPLVNQKGEVVGVCSAGLFGENIAHVGFAVPAEDVLKLAQSKQISLDGRSSLSPLDGPELAKLVTPATAYVKVSMGIDTSNTLFYSYSGHFGSNRALSNAKSGSGTAAMSRQGELLYAPDNESLPLLGSFASLPFERLPTSSENSWQSRTVTAGVLVTTEPNSFLGRSTQGMGRYRYALPPSLQKQTTTIIPIIELTKYQLRESTGNLQKIEKHYQMIAVKQEGQEPLQQLTGRGEIIFDCEAGCIKECNMELEVSRRQGNVVETMPLKYSYQLGDVYTREQWNTKLAEASVQAKKQMSDYEQRQIEREREEKVKGRKLIEDSIAGLDKLRGTNLYLKLSEISRVKPIPEYRDQISKLVDPYLLSKESSVRSSALDVIKTWGTSHNKTNLLKLLDSLDNLTRENACECLANCVKEPDVAEKIASLFDSDDASDHYAAKDALKEMGAVAEDVVLKLLDREDEEMRSTAIDLLCEMGTNKCIPFLQKIIDSRANRSLSSSAQTALSAIDRRLAKGAK